MNRMDNDMHANQSDSLKMPILQHRLLIALLLLLIVMVGGYLRFNSQNWDDFSALHPDERYLTRNLLPLLGGSLELTPDAKNYPDHVLLANLADTTMISRFDLAANTALRAGGIQHTLGGDLAQWIVTEDRYSTYANMESAVQALTVGEIHALILPQSSVQTLLAGGAQMRIVESYDSVAVQQMRCTALYPETGGAGGYFDANCSPLNPHNAASGAYSYGTLPLFIAHFASQVVRAGGISFVDFQGETLVWRFFSALFDTAAIVLIFLTGRRLHNSWVGLIAALIYAFAPLAIQKSHFGTVNAITNFFVTLAIWAAASVQDRARFRDFVIFGIALGAALAGRINILPLAGVVVLAAMVYAAPVLDRRIAWVERERLLWRAVSGVILAGAFTVLAFRIFNPYAFEGPSFFQIGINSRWIADAQSSSYNVSGASDIPPNWQWLGRFAYFYPLKDLVLWGIGIAAGITAIFGFFWSGYRLALGKAGAIRTILPFAWTLVYFAWMGRVWVMTMRYYLPLYGTLALLAAWALVELLRIASKQGRTPMQARLLLAVFGAVLAITALSAGGTTTALAAGIVALVLLVSLVLPAGTLPVKVLLTFVTGFTVLWGLMFSNIYTHQLTRVQAARWMWENVSGDFSMQLEGVPEGTPLVNIAIGNSSGDSAEKPEDLLFSATRFDVGIPRFAEFVAPATGTISEVLAPHLADPLDTPEAESLYISLARQEGDSSVLLAEAVLTMDFTRANHVLGDRYVIPLDQPVEVVEGVRYTFKVEALAGTFVSGGEVMLTEGAWDDRITTTMVCELPDGLTFADDPRPGLADYDSCNGRLAHYALLQSYDLVMSYPVDEEIKRDNIVDGLGAGDYLAVTSNRFYDTESRNPARFPFTTRFYELLFAGELQYELIAVFTEGYELGPLSVNDQHLPIYSSPAWLNELEADEAFHVYDHPAVFVFRKQADYDHHRTELLLNEIPLLRIEGITAVMQDPGAQIPGVVYWTSLEADRAPTALEMPTDIRTINREGGTWSERFDSDSLLNQYQPAGVIVWWVVIVVIGWVMVPILFVAFPEIGDRGFGFAKIIGLLVIGWAAWLAANFKIPLWSQGGLLLIAALLVALSAAAAWKKREALTEYLRGHWRQLLLMEVLSLLMFVVFIGIRLTNPDLWHHPMGGEKPMDFAYFNAVLRTTAFPVYDPWYADGYINYYYFGYVIMGVPVLLLKIVPAFAYNLIIPTLFSLAGMGAFSAAYNIVDRWTEGGSARSGYGRLRMGNPWIAGMAALLLCVVLGNLDVPRVLAVEGVARLGGYSRPTGLETYLVDQYIDQNGIEPDEAARQSLKDRAARGYLTDEIAYEISIKADFVTSFFRGLAQAVSGSTLPIGSNRWYWAPTRVIQETPGVGGNAITEIPYFTFLYGDLHAHMISMPIMLFVIFFVFYEVAIAQQDSRSAGAILLALLLGGLSVGMLRAINTWDWPSFLLLGVLGLGYAWWRRYEEISRLALVVLFASVGAFMTSAWLVVLPFVSWFGSVYNSAALWEGGKTPLWAFLDIHGLFLFLLVSFLIWDTVRWLRSTRAQVLAGRGSSLSIGAAVVTAVLLLSLALAMIEYQAALVILPLILWIAVLFFRPGQHVVVQYVLVLAGFALALTLAVEFVVLSGDIGRQNTVFKFYIQIWLLFSVAGGTAFAWLVQHVDEWSNRMRTLWTIPLLLLVLTAAMFPVLATRARMVDRFVPDLPVTLNGLDYMQQATHVLIDYGIPIQLANDYQIIRWLQENVEGTPVVLEGRSLASEYRYNGRISITTGLPTILGWNWHQRQQRTLDPLSRFVQQREANIQFLYNTTDMVRIVPMLRHYDVRYIIVSDMELQMYPAPALAKFERMAEMGLLQVAFQSGDARVYQVDVERLEAFALHTSVFYEAIGLDPAWRENYASGFPGSEADNPDAADIRDVVQRLAQYEMEYLMVSDPTQLEVVLPETYARLTRLEDLDILLVSDDRLEWRIWMVNRDAVLAFLAEENE